MFSYRHRLSRLGHHFPWLETLCGLPEGSACQAKSGSVALMQHNIHPVHTQVLPWQVSRAAILKNDGAYTSIRSKTDLLSVFCHSRATGRRAAGSTPSSHTFPVYTSLRMAHTETHHLLNAVPGTNLPAGRELPAQLQIQPMGCFLTKQQLLWSSSSCKTSNCFSPSGSHLLLSETAAPEI